MTDDSPTFGQRVARHTGAIISGVLTLLGLVGLVILIIGAIAGNTNAFDTGGIMLTFALVLAIPYGLGYGAAVWRRRAVPAERLAAIEEQLAELREHMRRLDDLHAALDRIEDAVTGSTVRPLRRRDGT